MYVCVCTCIRKVVQEFIQKITPTATSVGFPAKSTLQMIMNGILELLVYRMSVDMGEGGMVCISPGMNITPFLVKVKIRMCALLMPHR